MRLRVFTLALLSLACAKKAEAPDPLVVAVVNGEIIARRDFELELSRELSSLDSNPQLTPEQLGPYKTALLDTIIERTLLLQAARTANVAATPEEVDRRVLAMASEYPAESFDTALEEGRMSRTELTRRTREQLVIEKLFAQEVNNRLAVNEESVRQYFDEHPEEFSEPEQVRVSQIVVAGMEDAKKIQSQLYQGKKFPDLARRFSISPDARVGGDLGFFPRGVMPAAFDDAVFRLGVGQVSEVVTSEYGYHLFRLAEKRPARKKELADVRAKIEEKLVERLRARDQKKYIERLKSTATIIVNQPTLLAVNVKPQMPKRAEP